MGDMTQVGQATLWEIYRSRGPNIRVDERTPRKDRHGRWSQSYRVRDEGSHADLACLHPLRMRQVINDGDRGGLKILLIKWFCGGELPDRRPKQYIEGAGKVSQP